jgi:hypothetical protein
MPKGASAIRANPDDLSPGPVIDRDLFFAGMLHKSVFFHLRDR